MRLCNWNEYNLNPLTRINWRASLVPAAAVTPAPIAYIKVVAVKKLVVGSQVEISGQHYAEPLFLPRKLTDIKCAVHSVHLVLSTFTLRK